MLAGRLEAAEQTEAQGGGAACRALLPGIEADLQRAGLAGSLLHARWWQAHSLCRRDQADQAAQRLASMQQAEALFARLAPGQRPHVTVLGELAVEHLSQRQLEASIRVGLRAVRMSQALAQRNEAELQTLHSNLGLAYGSDGRLREASDAFGQAAAVAERTSGINAPVAWPIRSKQARLLHLTGDRAGANKLFEALLAQLPAAAESGPNANVAREDIGTCLLAEGQAQAGLVLLQQAEQGHLRGADYEFDLRRVRRQIGDALDRLGRFDEARQALAWALADAQAHDQPASQELASTRERWARFQLDRGDLPGAQASFAKVIAQAGRKTWVQVALAQAGQARAALAQGDGPAALALSESALLRWGQRSGRFDIRMQAYLWRVRAVVLDRLGRPEEARALRDQALAAARRTDSPTSPTLTQPGYLGL